ncbi:MAG: choice-of-anchor E domain-containing protein [Chthoniobacteraceae bacterium]
MTGTYGETLTNYSGTITVDGFDTSLGTLESVTVSLQGNLSTVLTVTAGASGATDVNSYTSVTFTLSDAGGYVSLGRDVSSDHYTISSMTPNEVVTSGTLTGTDTRTTAALTSAGVLQEFTASTVTFATTGTAATWNSYTGGNVTTAQVTYGDEVVTVTYNYTVVPEPATWAMLFGGFGALVLVQRMRRLKVA